MAGSSLKVLSGEIDSSGYDVYIMYAMSGVSLFLLVFVNPIIFYFGIKYTRPNKDLFDENGGNTKNKRELYYNLLQKVNTPFKELFNLFSYSGSYYGLIMMLLKFTRMCLMVTNPMPY